MAQLKLNSTQSIVDFFKSKGLTSDFSTRERVFKNLGLENRLGIYTGGERQNPAFIRALGNFQDEQIKGALKGPVSAAPPVEAPKEPGIAVPPQLKDVVPEGTTAADALKILGIPEPPSAVDVAQQALESPEFKQFKEKQEVEQLGQKAEAEAKKRGLETKFTGDLATLENNLAAKGLTFSGVKTSQIESLTGSLAASQLGVDREIAQRLLSQNVELKGQILKSVENILEKAKQGRKDALDALKDIGLTVIGDKILPTLAAKSAELAERREARLAAEDGKAGTFTSTQLNVGAANARMSIDEFGKLDEDTKNFFINRGPELKKSFGFIDEAKVNAADPNELYKEIQEGDFPDFAKNRLTDYLKKQFPGVDVTKPKKSWWQRLFD